MLEVGVHDGCCKRVEAPSIGIVVAAALMMLGQLGHNLLV